MSRSRRKNVSRCPASPTLPDSPGSAVPGMWPTASCSVRASLPARTTAETPRRGISMRPIISPVHGRRRAAALRRACAAARARRAREDRVELAVLVRLIEVRLGRDVAVVAERSEPMTSSRRSSQTQDARGAARARRVRRQRPRSSAGAGVIRRQVAIAGPHGQVPAAGGAHRHLHAPEAAVVVRCWSARSRWL